MSESSRKWASREILGQKGKELEARNSEEMFLLDHMRRYTGIELLIELLDLSWWWNDVTDADILSEIAHQARGLDHTFIWEKRTS